MGARFARRIYLRVLCATSASSALKPSDRLPHGSVGREGRAPTLPSPMLRTGEGLGSYAINSLASSAGVESMG